MAGHDYYLAALRLQSAANDFITASTYLNRELGSPHTWIDNGLEVLSKAVEGIGFTLTPIQPDTPAEEPADLVMGR